MNTAASTSTPRGFQNVWLVAEREVGSKLRSRAFVISTVITLLIALAAVIWGGFSAGNPSATKVAVTSSTAAAVEKVPGVEVTQVADQDAAEALVRSGEVSAAVVDDASSPTGLVVIAEDSPPTSLLMGFGPKLRPPLLVGRLGGAFLEGRLGASSKLSDWPKPPKSSPPPMSKL